MPYGVRGLCSAFKDAGRKGYVPRYTSKMVVHCWWGDVRVGPGWGCPCR